MSSMPHASDPGPVATTTPEPRGPREWLPRTEYSGPPWPLHVAIVVFLLFGAAYAAFQVFVTMAPPGHVGPMWGEAPDLPFEHMVVRRLYAMESWVIFIGLSLYLGSVYRRR